MQRKVFRIGGKPVLVTRGGGLYETAATLQGLLALGRERIGARLARAAVEKAAAPPAAASPVRRTPEPDLNAEQPARPISKRRTTSKSMPVRRIEPAAEDDVTLRLPLETPQLKVRASGPPSALLARRPRGSREPRWVTAGAERRGRAGVHWSTRLR